MKKTFARIGLFVTSILAAIMFIIAGIIAYSTKQTTFMPAINRLIKSLFTLKTTDNLFTGWLFIVAIIAAVVWLVMCIRRKHILIGITGSIGLIVSIASLAGISEFKKYFMNPNQFGAVGKASIIIFAISLLLFFLMTLFAFFTYFDICNSENFDKIVDLDDDKGARLFTTITTIVLKVILYACAIAFFIMLIAKPRGVAERMPKLVNNIGIVFDISRWPRFFFGIGMFGGIFTVYSVIKIIANINNKKSVTFPLALLMNVVAVEVAVLFQKTINDYLISSNTFFKFFSIMFIITLSLLTLFTILSMIAENKMNNALAEVDGINETNRKLEEQKALFSQALQEAAASSANQPAVEETNADEQIEKTQEEPKTIVEEQVEEAKEETTSAVEEQTIETTPLSSVEENNNITLSPLDQLKKNKIVKKTLDEKLKMAEQSVRDNFKTVKSSFADNGFKIRKCKYFVAIRYGRDTVAKITLIGKTLKLYFALNPNDYKITVYHQKDMSESKKYASIPMMVKVRSPLSVKRACRLVNELKNKTMPITTPEADK